MSDPAGQVDTGRITHIPQMHREVSWKASVRVATTANGTLTTAFDNGSTIDGVTLATGDRILIKNQTDQKVNGIYVVNASGAPSRTYDSDIGPEFPGAVVLVREGSTLAGTLWYCTNLTDPVLGTDNVTWSQWSGGSGAPTTADYLVGTSQAGLSAEIVVGTTPGGELGNTWASPTVDTTHSGSAHADFIAKSVLTTQDDIIVRDASAPARLAKGSDGQVLTVDPTTHHLVWATPSTGIAGIGVKEAGSTVVASATALDFLNPGFDVTSPGGGVAAIAFDPSEIALDTLGTPTDITTLNSTTGQHGLLPKLGGGTVNFLRADGSWSDPGVPSGSSFNEAVYGKGTDGNVTISVDTSLTRDMYYNNLTVNTGISLNANAWRVFVAGTLTLTGTGKIHNNGGLGGNGGNGTGAAGGGAGAAGSSTSGNNLNRGAAGTIGRVGGFNAVGLTGTVGQTATMFREDGTAITPSNGGNGGAGANAGGSGASAVTGTNALDAKPIAYPSCVEFKEMASGTTINMDNVVGKTPGGGSGGGSATGGGGGSGGCGSGGGPVVLVAKTWTGSGNVESKGGAGGNGGNGFASSGSNGGGAAGSGGPGGWVTAIYSDRSGWSGSVVVTGGAAGSVGTGNGGGANGGAGSSGATGIKMEYHIS